MKHFSEHVAMRYERERDNECDTADWFRWTVRFYTSHFLPPSLLIRTVDVSWKLDSHAHTHLINKSKTSLIPSLLDRNLILQVQSIETRMHFSIANYMLWGWYQPQSFREFRCYSSIQKIVHINFIEFSFIIKLKLNIESYSLQFFNKK